MTGQIVDLAQWRQDHPPAVRLANIGMHCWFAYWRLCAAASRAIWRLYGQR